MAYSGLLVVDFTVFVLTIARSIRLWTHSEPFLYRILFDGAFMTPIPINEPIKPDHPRPSLLWVQYTAAFRNRY